MLSLKSRREALEDTTKQVCERLITFTDRAYYVSYVDNITILIDRPKKGTYEPSYIDNNKEFKEDYDPVYTECAKNTEQLLEGGLLVESQCKTIDYKPRQRVNEAKETKYNTPMSKDRTDIIIVVVVKVDRVLYDIDNREETKESIRVMLAEISIQDDIEKLYSQITIELKPKLQEERELFYNTIRVKLNYR